MNKIPFADNELITLSPEEIEGFKKKYDEVIHVKLKVKGFDSENPQYKQCWLHRPGRKELAYSHVQSRKENADPYLYNEVLAKQIWLAGNKDILTNDYYFLGLSAKMDEIIQFADAELEKK